MLKHLSFHPLPLLESFLHKKLPVTQGIHDTTLNTTREEARTLQNLYISLKSEDGTNKQAISSLIEPTTITLLNLDIILSEWKQHITIHLSEQ